MSGYQKGLAGWLNAGAEIIRDFPYLETDAQFTFPYLSDNCLRNRMK
jgi:hypothetical protein